MTTAIVTGGNAGIGYFVSEQLAQRGIRVITAGRSEQKADVAAAAIRARCPSADLGFVRLDLSSLASVTSAAASLSSLGPIDILVDNAGLTGGSRRRETTADGLELMVGTNAYGHFALMAQLWPSLSPDARVVGLGSLSTRLARADLADPEQKNGNYSLSRGYATSKHFVHAIAFELDRRLRGSGSGIRSVLAHPGFAMDSLGSQRHGITDTGSFGVRFGEHLMGFMAQGKDRGALPVVHAALHGEGGEFWGPSASVKGRPALARPVAQSAAPAFTAEVWHLAEQATGLRFPL